MNSLTSIFIRIKNYSFTDIFYDYLNKFSNLCEPLCGAKYNFNIEKCLQRRNVNYEKYLHSCDSSCTYVQENLLLRRIVQETEIKFSVNINEYAIIDGITS
jgi:hypothetical protein